MAAGSRFDRDLDVPQPVHPLALSLLPGQISVIAQTTDDDPAVLGIEAGQIRERGRHAFGVDILAAEDPGPRCRRRDVDAGIFKNLFAGRLCRRQSGLLERRRCRPAATPPRTFHVKRRSRTSPSRRPCSISRSRAESTPSNNRCSAREVNMR